MIVPFEPWHLLAIDIQAQQSARYQTERHAEFLAAHGHCAYTCLNASGRPVMSAGIVPMWPGRAMAWASLAHDVGRNLVEATRRTRQELDDAPFTRIEMYITPGFHQAVRWATVQLGFKYEATMERGGADGRDLWVFTRFNDLSGQAVKRLKNAGGPFHHRRR